MKMTCLIVDDEPLSRELLETFVNDCGLLEITAICKDAIEAMQQLQRQTVDVVFLDINMPKISGLSLVKSLQHPPLIIFTTAYPQYAVEGFDLDAVDYLLKPFSFERFMKAVNKAMEKLQTTSPPKSGANDYLLIKADSKTYKINYEDLFYFHARGDYLKVHTREKVLVTHDSLKRLETVLPTDSFMRVHKSYLIALDKVQYIEGNQVKIRAEKIPIGAAYKEAFLRKLEEK